MATETVIGVLLFTSALLMYAAFKIEQSKQWLPLRLLMLLSSFSLVIPSLKLAIDDMPKLLIQSIVNTSSFAYSTVIMFTIMIIGYISVVFILLLKKYVSTFITEFQDGRKVKASKS